MASNEKLRKEVEVNVRLLCCLAAIYALTQKATWCLGLLQFTWATVVLLGGSLEQLLSVDFILVSCLILAEAIRWGLALWLSRLLTLPYLVRGKHPTEDIVHAQERLPQELQDVQGSFIQRQTELEQQRQLKKQQQMQASRGNLALAGICASAGLQVMLGGFYIAAGVWRLSGHHSYKDNRHTAIIIFWALCLLCGCCAVASPVIVLYGSFFCLRGTSALWRVAFDHLCNRCLQGSLLDGVDFDFHTWLLSHVASELRAGHQAVVMFDATHGVYRDAPQYLCADRYGYVLLESGLQSSDRFMQEVCASLFGFWPADGMEDLSQQQWLLKGLVAKIGCGQVGYAALNSVAALLSAGVAAGSSSAGEPYLKLSDLTGASPDFMPELLRLTRPKCRLELPALRLWAHALHPMTVDDLNRSLPGKQAQLLDRKLADAVQRSDPQAGMGRIRVWAALARAGLLQAAGSSLHGHYSPAEQYQQIVAAGTSQGYWCADDWMALEELIKMWDSIA